MIRDGKRKLEEVCDVLQAIKDGKFRFANKTAGEVSTDVRNNLARWQTFYHEIWGIKKDFSDLQIPNPKDGFGWLIVMLEGMTTKKIFQKMLDYMKVWVWDEKYLNKVTSARTTNKDYSIFVRDRIEADEELKNLSADDLKANGTNCITLEERLMLEFFYWWETKKHLDIQNVTLCAGSRCSDGSVPRAYLRSVDGRVDVGGGDSNYRGESLRSREAVS